MGKDDGGPGPTRRHGRRADVRRAQPEPGGGRGLLRRATALRERPGPDVAGQGATRALRLSLRRRAAGRPPGACAIIARERRAPNDTPRRLGIPIQVGFEYSDGAGQRLREEGAGRARPRRRTARRAGSPTARPSSTTRASRSTSTSRTSRRSGHRFEEPVAAGVTADHVLRRRRPADPHRVPRRHAQPRRVLAVVQPQLRPERHGHASRATRWYAERTTAPGEPGRQARRRARRARAATPAQMHFDSLGRDVIAIAHNRTPSDDPAVRATRR